MKLGLLLDLRSRAKEERELVLREAAGAVASLGQQLARMDTRLQVQAPDTKNGLSCLIQ